MRERGLSPEFPPSAFAAGEPSPNLSRDAGEFEAPRTLPFGVSTGFGAGKDRAAPCRSGEASRTCQAQVASGRLCWGTGTNGIVVGTSPGKCCASWAPKLTSRPWQRLPGASKVEQAEAGWLNLSVLENVTGACAATTSTSSLGAEGIFGRCQRDSHILKDEAVEPALPPLPCGFPVRIQDPGPSSGGAASSGASFSWPVFSGGADGGSSSAE